MKSKGNLMIELIVMAFFAVIVVGFFILYYNGHVGSDIQKTEINAQISRCCTKIISNGKYDGNIMCVDDPKLIKAINDNCGSSYKNLAPIRYLVSMNYTTEKEIESICGI